MTGTHSRPAVRTPFASAAASFGAAFAAGGGGSVALMASRWTSVSRLLTLRMTLANSASA